MRTPDGPTLWPVPRRWTALLAVVVAATTGLAAVTVTALDADQGETGMAMVLAVIHLGTAGWVAFQPTSLPMQVGAGVLLAATPLLASDDVVVGVVPIVAGVVATAELLSAAGRLGVVVPRDPAPGHRQAWLTTLVAAAASSVTLAVGALAGPTGLVAVLLGAGACAGVALLLQPSPPAPPE